MPIRIREVHIKATVSEDESQQQASSTQHNAIDIQSIVATCVEQVLRKLKEQQER
jgi:hypothetical protein